MAKLILFILIYKRNVYESVNIKRLIYKLQKMGIGGLYVHGLNLILMTELKVYNWVLIYLISYQFVQLK